MQPIRAIALLTIKAAFRFRVVLTLLVVLMGLVVILPLMIKDDGTARGFTQILLTYTLTLIMALLGFATLWLACGTMARDVEEAQIQMVAVKPVARWQIWLGKWLGVLALNAILLGFSATAVYFLLQYRASQLSDEQQEVLRNEIFVARGSIKEPMPNLEPDVDKILRMRLQEEPVAAADVPFLRQQVREQVRAAHQVVLPGHMRQWRIDLGLARHYLRDQPLYARIRFNVPQENEGRTYYGILEVGEPSTGILRRDLSVAADTFHQLELPPNLFNEQGILSVRFMNWSETAMLFPLEDGLEVLYREGGFALNYIRGVLILFMWLGLLSAIGLAAASFLSFPVAAFLAMCVLLMGLSSGLISQIIEQGSVVSVNPNTGYADKMTVVDYVAIPTFKAVLRTINLARDFSPIDSLSSGRSISWGELARAFVQIMVFLCGLLAVFGMVVFTRRELATAQQDE
jgi:hypothetical protein